MAAARAQLRAAAAAAQGGKFSWSDGALLAAIEHGHWVLLQHPNACSGSVLDRLNSLLENAGFLYVNEAGSTAAGPRVVTPHADFRIFLVADPARGEVSRAMRNRGIEVFWPAAPSPLVRAPASPMPCCSAGTVWQAVKTVAMFGVALCGQPRAGGWVMSQRFISRIPSDAL